MLRSALKSLFNILYPKTCVVCKNALKEGSFGDVICSQCYSKIKKNRPPLCKICGKPLRDRRLKAVCSRCQKEHILFDRALSVYAYEGPIKELIHQFKYKGKGYLDKILARLLEDFIKQHKDTFLYFDVIMPLPLHKSRMREREFNQAQVLARHINSDLGLAFSCENLKRIRPTTSQTELGGDERRKNIRDCFKLKNADQVKGKNILLVDDVLTTGATCSEAAGVLKEAGAKAVFVITLAN